NPRSRTAAVDLLDAALSRPGTRVELSLARHWPPCFLLQRARLARFRRRARLRLHGRTQLAHAGAARGQSLFHAAPCRPMSAADSARGQAGDARRGAAFPGKTALRLSALASRSRRAARGISQLRRCRMPRRPKLTFISLWNAADPLAESGYAFSMRQQL